MCQIGLASLCQAIAQWPYGFGRQGCAACFKFVHCVHLLQRVHTSGRLTRSAVPFVVPQLQFLGLRVLHHDIGTAAALGICFKIDRRLKLPRVTALTVRPFDGPRSRILNG